MTAEASTTYSIKGRVTKKTSRHLKRRSTAKLPVRGQQRVELRIADHDPGFCVGHRHDWRQNESSLAGWHGQLRQLCGPTLIVPSTQRLPADHRHESQGRDSGQQFPAKTGIIGGSILGAIDAAQPTTHLGKRHRGCSGRLDQRRLLLQAELQTLHKSVVTIARQRLARA